MLLVSQVLEDGADEIQVIGGIASGFLYVAETTAMLSYPPHDDRGFYLGNH